jgi:glycine betaine/choline ABC-type transport system substrate-binding protein
MTRSPRSVLAACTAALMVFAISACGGEGGGSGGGGGGGGGGGAAAKTIQPVPDAASRGTITVGSKNFPEQVLLGNIYGQALEKAGFKVKTDLDLGDAQVSYKALQGGNIDLYPEYMGTALTNFYKQKATQVPKDVQGAYQVLKTEAKKEKVTALSPTPFEDDFAPTMLKTKADQMGINTLSDLGPKSKDLRFAGFPECEQREDCLIGLKRAYGIEPKEFISTEEKRQPLDTDAADVVFFFSTDGELTLPKYKRIQDDKKFYPPYNVSVLVRDPAVKKLGPEGQKVIDQVEQPLTEAVMQELNSRVTLDKKKESEVATEYLKESGFIK